MGGEELTLTVYSRTRFTSSHVSRQAGVGIPGPCIDRENVTAPVLLRLAGLP